MKKQNRKLNAFVMLGTLLAVAAVLGFFAIGTQTQEGPLVSLRIETDKDVYTTEENVTITLYFNNDESYNITVDTMSYQLEVNGVAGFVFGMTTEEIRNDTVTILAYSEVLIDSYTWDQIDFNWNPVPAGEYTVNASLLDYPLEGQKSFEIQE